MIIKTGKRTSKDNNIDDYESATKCNTPDQTILDCGCSLYKKDRNAGNACDGAWIEKREFNDVEHVACVARNSADSIGGVAVSLLFHSFIVSAGLTKRGAIFRLAPHIPAEPFGKNILSMI